MVRFCRRGKPDSDCNFGRMRRLRFRLRRVGMQGMRTSCLFVALAVLLAGCGKKLTGRYEATPEIPRMPMMAGLDPKVKRQMDDMTRKVQDMNRVSLVFDGSKVRMGTATAVSEYRYRIDGKKLEVIAEAMGQKTIMPMTIEDDGTISYNVLRFYKVD
jgi:hypothetical protein